jgi:imidazolonepropionase-like amidohydrolase
MLLRADWVVDGTLREPLPGGVVAVDQGRISAVGPLADFGSRWSDEPVYDFPGCTLLPGLVDTHVHLTFDASTHPVRELQAASDARLVLRGARNARAMLQAGVTTVRDLGCRNRTALDVRDAILSQLTPGPRLLASGRPVTAEGGHLHFFGGAVSGEAAVRRLVRELIDEGVDAIKLIATGGNMTLGSDPLRPAFSLAEVRAVVDEAHATGRKVAAHARSVAGMQQVVEAEVDSVEHSRMEIGPGVWGFDEPLAERMARKAIVAAPTMAASHRAFEYRARGGDVAVQPIALDTATRQENAARLRACGVQVVVGTDAGAALASFDEATHLELELLVGAGWTPLEALHAGTLAAARSLGLGAEIGSLEPGKVADIVAVVGEPARSIDHIRRVYCVFQAGLPTVFDGQIIQDARDSLGYRLARPAPVIDATRLS